MAVVVIPPVVRIVAFHLLLSDLFEREFDEVKLVKRMALAVAATLMLTLLIDVIGMR